MFVYNIYTIMVITIKLQLYDNKVRIQILKDQIFMYNIQLLWSIAWRLQLYKNNAMHGCYQNIQKGEWVRITIN